MIPGVEVVPRAAWLGAVRPFAGPALVLAWVNTFVLHYTAAKNVPDGDPGELGKVRGFLANMAAYYWRARMYALGYNFAVDHLGVVYELRGFDIRCAANKGWNERSIAVLCLVDGDDPMHPAMLRSVNAIYAEIDRRTGRACALKGHSDIGATACPGNGIRSQISDGAVRPEPISPAPPAPITPPTTTGDRDMHVHEPFRNSDTRKFGTMLQPGTDYEFGVTVPADAVAVVMNVAAVQPSADGWLAIWGTGAYPGTSTVNAKASAATNGFAIVPCPNRTVKVRVATPMHVVLDVCGWMV